VYAASEPKITLRLSPCSYLTPEISHSLGNTKIFLKKSVCWPTFAAMHVVFTLIRIDSRARIRFFRNNAYVARHCAVRAMFALHNGNGQQRPGFQKDLDYCRHFDEAPPSQVLVAK
jgi:hypothetical protein